MGRKCDNCSHTGIDKGRAFDGRRAYRCQKCGNEWTEGMQGRERKHSKQRMGSQFHDTGAGRAANKPLDQKAQQGYYSAIITG